MRNFGYVLLHELKAWSTCSVMQSERCLMSMILLHDHPPCPVCELWHFEQGIPNCCVPGMWTVITSRPVGTCVTWCQCMVICQAHFVCDLHWVHVETSKVTRVPELLSCCCSSMWIFKIPSLFFCLSHHEMSTFTVDLHVLKFSSSLSSVTWCHPGSSPASPIFSHSPLGSCSKLYLTLSSQRFLSMMPKSNSIHHHVCADDPKSVFLISP